MVVWRMMKKFELNKVQKRIQKSILEMKSKPLPFRGIELIKGRAYQEEVKEGIK